MSEFQVNFESAYVLSPKTQETEIMDRKIRLHDKSKSAHNNIESQVDQVRQRVNDLYNSGDEISIPGYSELLGIRRGYDGVDYDDAGTAVREQVKTVLQYAEQNIESIEDIIGKTTLYNGLEKDTPSDGGGSFYVYALKQIIPQGTKTKLKIKIAKDCTFHYYFMDIVTNKIVFADAFEAKMGMNEVHPDFIPDTNCYLCVDGEPNKIYYDVNGSCEFYAFTTESAYWQVGEVHPIGKWDICEISILIELSPANLYNEIQKLDSTIEESIGKVVFYDGLDKDASTHFGEPYKIYSLMHVIPAHNRLDISLRVFKECIFHFYYIAVDNGEVLYAEALNAVAGINNVSPAFAPDRDYYLFIDGEADKIFYSDKGASPFIFYQGQNYLSIGDVIVPSSKVEYTEFSIAYSAIPVNIAENIKTLKSSMEESIESVENMIGKTVLYNGLNKLTPYSNGGNFYVYALKQIIPKGIKTRLKFNIAEDCSFHYYFMDVTKNTILFADVIEAKMGINEVYPDFVPEAPCYLCIDGEPKKIYYEASGSCSFYAFNRETAYWQVGEIHSIGNWQKAEFSVFIELIPTNLYVEIKKLESRVEESLNGVTIYDGLSKETTAHSGTPYKAYGLPHIVPADNRLNISMKIFATCTFHFYYIAVDNGEVLYAEALEANEGINIVSPEFAPDRDYYLFIDAEENKIFYTPGGTNPYLTYQGSDYLSAGKVIALPSSIGYADFSITYTTIPVNIAGSILKLRNQIASANSPLYGKVVLLAGDSRSSTDYTFYKSTLEAKCGCTVLLQGASGRNVAHNASSEYFARFNGEHDFSIWIVGGNDSGSAGTIGTFSANSPLAQQGEKVVTETDITADPYRPTFIQAVDHMMRKYKSLYYNFKKLNNGYKPKMIFCSDLPMKIENPSDGRSDPKSWERKRLAIMECCEKNNVTFLDLLKLCNFDMSYEPGWPNNPNGITDKVNDTGLYFMDGLHPNQYGFDIITSLEIQEMLKYVTNNLYVG